MLLSWTISIVLVQRLVQRTWLQRVHSHTYSLSHQRSYNISNGQRCGGLPSPVCTMHILQDTDAHYSVRIVEYLTIVSQWLLTCAQKVPCICTATQTDVCATRNSSPSSHLVASSQLRSNLGDQACPESKIHRRCWHSISRELSV